MGIISRVIRPAGTRSYENDNHPTMHETKGEWRLASGKGGLIKRSGDHVQVTGERPQGRRR
jgi:hypothetical protein